MNAIKELEKIASLEDVLNIYQYGSRVYGTASDKSDYDFIIITTDSPFEIPKLRNKSIEIQYFSKSEFENRIKNQKIDALECLSLDEKFIIKKIEDFKSVKNIQKLRESISQTSSNSWVKAKKKITLENEDSYIGLKSIFHSLRILDFGIQIAKHGKILDFSSSNKIWEDIKSLKNPSWETLNSLFKEEYNRRKSNFKKVAPKIRRKL